MTPPALPSLESLDGLTFSFSKNNQDCCFEFCLLNSSWFQNLSLIRLTYFIHQFFQKVSAHSALGTRDKIISDTKVSLPALSFCLNEGFGEVDSSCDATTQSSLVLFLISPPWFLVPHQSSCLVNSILDPSKLSMPLCFIHTATAVAQVNIKFCLNYQNNIRIHLPLSILWPPATICPPHDRQYDSLKEMSCITSVF